MKKRNNSLLLGLYISSFILMIIGVAIILEIVSLGIAIAAIGFVDFIIACICKSKYNSFVMLSNKVDQSMALIDIQLKLRFDLVPNLVEVVKEYEKHEKQVFTDVIKLRNLAANTSDEKLKLQYANDLIPKLNQVIVIAEAYPELKAEAIFRSLMDDLTEIEDKLVAARRIYDSNVNTYNTKIEVFPNNILADYYGFEKFELFKIDAAERINVKVNLTSKKGK